MDKQITIQIETVNHGNWLKIFIPPSSTNESNTVQLQSDNGEIIRSLKIASGNSVIDISNITNHDINLKVETPFETIFKKLKLSSL